MSELEGVLRRAAEQVFEGLCFLEVDHGAREAPRRWDLVSSVGFEESGGARRGAVVLRIHGVGAGQLAESMLGSEEVIDDALAFDAVGEMTNVMCGSVLSAYMGARAEFDLRRPTVSREGDGHGCPSRAHRRVMVGLERGVAQLELHVEHPGESP